MDPRSGPLGREGLLRRTLPFGVISVLALVAALLPPGGDDWAQVGAATALTALILVAVVALPWERLPAAAQIAPPLAYFAVVVLLRESQGGAASGYGPLILLPVIWLACYGTRGQLVLGILCGIAVVLVPPLVAESSAYPQAEFRRAAILGLVAAIAGFTLQRLVGEIRRRADEAAATARLVGRNAEQLASTVTRITREIAAAENPRQSICEAARELCDCQLAVLAEPSGDGELVVKGNAGPDVSAVRIRIGEEPSGSVVAMTSRQRFFVADARDHPAVSQKALGSTGVVSVLFEPVMHGGDVLGVLVVGWNERIESLSEWRAQVVPLLTAEAAFAIERAELIPRLAEMARVDALTGLPNRHVWDQELPRELARSARTQEPISVAMIDIDRFKDFNDAHGHQAGDELLKESAAAWRQSLREYDLLARYGGEEFAAIIAGTGLEHALEIVDRLRDKTSREQTCSAGVACWDGREAPGELVARADRALYAAKEGGRDRTMVAA